MNNYLEFLKTKLQQPRQEGFEGENLEQYPLFDWQHEITAWSCRKGQSSIFADCGLGKSIMQLAWADQVVRKTNKPVLIITPLAVSKQTEREGEKFGIQCKVVANQSDINKSGTFITNYEKLHHFDTKCFGGLVLDESSILKSFSGKVRRMIQEFADPLKYRLACTATPAPNDFLEIGTHSEFVNDLTRSEMLAMFFVHDCKHTQEWRLKGHASELFWKWMASWCVALRDPKDIGFVDDRFNLPELRVNRVVIDSKAPSNMFFALDAKTLNERRQARRDSLTERVTESAKLVNNSKEQWLVWCNLNAESNALAKAIPDSVEVSGSDSNEHKEKSMLAFSEGKIRCLVTKPTIAGHGMNWQNCHKMIFVGLSDSYEQYYQAFRRCWRFGQEFPVDIYIITASAEGAVVDNIKRKERQAAEMFDSLVQHVNLYGLRHQLKTQYDANTNIILPEWL